MRKNPFGLLRYINILLPPFLSAHSFFLLSYGRKRIRESTKRFSALIYFMTLFPCGYRKSFFFGMRRNAKNKRKKEAIGFLLRNGKNMTKIAPSLLACDFSKMGEEMLAIEKAGADLVHLDVMDGLFVPNISFGMPIIAALRPLSDIIFDVHLMIVDPERYIERFAEAGADMITVHLEACKDVTVALDTIRLNGKLSGLSIKPATPAEAVYPYLDKCDLILVMSVEPGYGGQKLIPETIEKVRLIREEASRRGLNELQISVDGGINASNAATVREAGADILVAGSSVFRADDKASAISELRG